MASAVRDSPENKKLPSKALLTDTEAQEEEEEEEELFEINLEAIDSIPPPHYWECHLTATSSTLLANCLLPISDVSGAIPMVSTACSPLSAKRMKNSFFIIAESTVQTFPGKFLGIPCLSTSK